MTWLRTLGSVIVAILIFTQLHWTQQFAHADVVLSGECLPWGHGEHVAKLCRYKDVSVRGDVMQHGFTITDQTGATFFVKTGSAWDIVAMSYPNDGAGFTWQTWALLILAVAVLLWGAYPAVDDLKRLSKSLDRVP